VSATTTALDVERALVGAVMSRPRDVGDLGVEPGDFADTRLGAIWHLMLLLDGEGTAPGAVAVQSNLRRIPDGTRISPELLLDLVHDAPVVERAPFLAGQVRNAAILRRVAAAGTRTVQLASEGGDAAEIVELARAEIDASTRDVARVRLIGEEIDDTLTAILDEPPATVATPWPDLDWLIGGWRPGGLYVFGARPGMGKTMAVVQAAVKAAAHGYVALHSLEMPREEVHTRVLAQVAQVDMGRMDRRELTEADHVRLSEALGKVSMLRLSIDDRGAIRPVDIRSHARTLARRGPLAMIVVDYLQLMSGMRGDRRPRHEQVAEWSRSLKLLGKEMRVPVLAASQLNRESMGRSDRRPSMADLRESGAIEQDADVICLLHVDEDEAPEVMEVQVAKNRQGRTGNFKLVKRGHVARLDNYEWRPSRAAGEGRE